MSAQPVEDPEDPQVILHGLPERERAEFLRQYREAAARAREDVGQYKELRLLLHRWRMVVLAAGRPGYYEAIEDAKRPDAAAVPLQDAIAAELARRR